MRIRPGATIPSLPWGDSVPRACTICRNSSWSRRRVGRRSRSTTIPGYCPGGYLRIGAKSSSAVTKHRTSRRHTSASCTSATPRRPWVRDRQDVVTRRRERRAHGRRQNLVDGRAPRARGASPSPGSTGRPQKARSSRLMYARFSRSTLGCRAAMRSKTNAGPVGMRRSQLRSVWTLIPSAVAKLSCDSPVTRVARRDGAGRSHTNVIRSATCVPSRSRS